MQDRIDYITVTLSSKKLGHIEFQDDTDLDFNSRAVSWGKDNHPIIEIYYNFQTCEMSENYGFANSTTYLTQHCKPYTKPIEETESIGYEYNFSTKTNTIYEKYNDLSLDSSRFKKYMYYKDVLKNGIKRYYLMLRNGIVYMKLKIITRIHQLKLLMSLVHAVGVHSKHEETISIS